MVESESPPMECCAQKMVGDDHYTLWHDLFHRSLPYECLNDCVYTKTGTSSPKFCFVRGDLRTECLSDEVEIEIESQVDTSGGHHGSGSGSGHHGSGSGDHETYHGSGSGDHETYHGSGSGSGDHGSGLGSGPAIELVGGAGPHEGNLMISGRPVCDHGQNPENAEVVCRQLGYLGGNLTTGSHFGTVPEDDFAMNDVHCNGTEGYIWRCPHENSINRTINCTREEGMGVICSGEPGSESGSGSGSDSIINQTTTEAATITESATTTVKVTVVVKDTSGDPVADAEVQLPFDGLETIVATTDIDGQARFTLSSDMMDIVNAGAPDGAKIYVMVVTDGYWIETTPKIIRPDEEFQTFEMSITPRS